MGYCKHPCPYTGEFKCCWGCSKESCGFECDDNPDVCNDSEEEGSEDDL